MTTTELDRRAWQARARYLGIDAALTAATWLDLTEDQARSILDDVDPALIDNLNEPNLSGEMADGPTPQSLTVEIAGDEGNADADIPELLAEAWESGVIKVWDHAVQAHACRVVGSLTAALRVERENELRADAARFAADRWSDLSDRWVPRLSERISRGVALLDDYDPDGWRERVKWNTLRMEVPALCVIGQLFTEDEYRSGDYDHGLDQLGLDPLEAARHGFDLIYHEIEEDADQHVPVTEMVPAVYETMADLWRSTAS